MLTSAFISQLISQTSLLAFLGSPGPQELLVVGIIALLLFGKRLPEVARNLGKGFSEFKKGMNGFQEEIRSASHEVQRPLEYSGSAKSSVENRPTVPESKLQADDEFAAPRFNAD